ncbi:MAG TPA: hypothetical protein VHZ78_08660 [Rhizomicrobium sp.]|jgi:hypothetical protein|nr:hypothetical protein [Rhizomicrobium sp.]
MNPLPCNPIAPPAVVRPATVTRGMVFLFRGRPLRVERVCGDDPAAPVIAEELADGVNGDIAYGKGQFALWSLAGVMRLLGMGNG